MTDTLRAALEAVQKIAEEIDMALSWVETQGRMAPRVEVWKHLSDLAHNALTALSATGAGGDLIDRAALLKKMRAERDGYLHENFLQDDSTGAWESGSEAKDDYLNVLDEQIEFIENFPSASSPGQEGAIIERCAIACEEQRGSEAIIAAPLTNAAYDEACRDCAGAIRALASSLVAETVAIQKWLVEFLSGAGPDLEGRWFGDRKEGEGAYWWRKHLRGLTQPAYVYDEEKHTLVLASSSEKAAKT